MKKTKRLRRPPRLASAAPCNTNPELRQTWESCADGFLDAELFQSRRVDPNLAVDGIPLLLVAAEGGHQAVVAVLLAHPKINPNLPIASGATPLLLAAQNGHLAVVKALLAHPQTDPNRSTFDEGVTPLFIATQNGHLGVVEALLTHDTIKADLPVEGIDALAFAVTAGFEDIAQSLLNHLQSCSEKRIRSEALKHVH